jgi:hypothetical protein
MGGEVRNRSWDEVFSEITPRGREVFAEPEEQRRLRRNPRTRIRWHQQDLDRTD